jgi:hypothetical protein
METRGRNLSERAALAGVAAEIRHRVSKECGCSLSDISVTFTPHPSALTYTANISIVGATGALAIGGDGFSKARAQKIKHAAEAAWLEQKEAHPELFDADARRKEVLAVTTAKARKLDDGDLADALRILRGTKR